MVKCCDQPVDLLIGPIVEKISVKQLRESGLHCRGLFRGTLFDAMAMVWRKGGESLLEGVDVEECDRKGTDATAGAPESARNFTEQGGGCPLKPMVGLVIERSRGERGWAGHSSSFHFDGEIDDEVAFG